MKALIVLLLLVAPAAADPDPAPSKPWAAGVSDSEQAVALDLYNQGNAEFQAARFAQALALYTQALAHWDHPAIHFNMAVCLINLDQPLDAKAHLDRALAYGADAIGQDVYVQGLTYQHSLDGQIARVRIACAEPGATITLDGVFAFTGPGEIERLVLPGRHQIVATKPGFLTATESVELLPARMTKHDVHLVAFKSVTRFERRWEPWRPYGVLAAGAATVGFGALAYLVASNTFADYDAAVVVACPHGCDAMMVAMLDGLNDRKRRGEIERDVAVSLFAIGGAVIVSGAIGIVLNQPRAAIDRRGTPGVALVHDGAVVTWAGSW